MNSQRTRVIIEHAGGRVRFCASPAEEGARTFVWFAEHATAVLLVDMRARNCGISITGAAGRFVAFVQRQEIGRHGIPWDQVRWFYRHSDGAFDEIVPMAFDGLYDAQVAFRPCGNRHLTDFLTQLRSLGMELDEHQLHHLGVAVALADSPAVSLA